MTTYSETALIKVTFSGRDGEGYISVPGLKVGDRVLVADTGSNTINTSYFYTLIDTADSIYQAHDSDQTAKTFSVVLVRFP